MLQTNKVLKNASPKFDKKSKKYRNEQKEQPKTFLKKHNRYFTKGMQEKLHP